MYTIVMEYYERGGGAMARLEYRSSSLGTWFVRPPEAYSHRLPDLNGNGRADVCDLADGTSEDYDGNGIVDEAEERVYVNAGALTGGDGRSWATASAASSAGRTTRSRSGLSPRTSRGGGCW